LFVLLSLPAMLWRVHYLKWSSASIYSSTFEEVTKDGS